MAEYYIYTVPSNCGGVNMDYEFLNKFPNKITYYYEVKKENSPKIYSIVIAP